MKLIFLLFGFSFLVSGHAEDNLMSVKLTPYFSYKDITTACVNQSLPSQFEFVAKVQATTIVWGQLKESTSDFFAERIQFQVDELNQLEIFQDEFGRHWIKNLFLSERLLNWVFFRAGKSLNLCEPPQSLASITPQSVRFLFNINQLIESNLSLNSQKINFKGQRKDGSFYQASLRWKQQGIQ
jgi:hypothetical protein